MPTEYEECIWIAVIDDRRGRLMRGRRLRSGTHRRLRLEEVQTIDNSLQELDRGARPGVKGYESRSVGTRSAELFARYAVDAVKWLTGQVQKRDIEELEVFASARLLALLRSMYSVTLGARVREHSFNVTGATVQELECRPELIQVVEERVERSAKRAS